jgi:outer membrane receptor for ferrienterochelin and colicin
MLTRRLTRFITALGLVLAAVVATDVHAQGVTTGGVSGFVTDSAGNPLEGAQISITNRTTGYTQRTLSRAGGRYNLPSLEVGGPYVLDARRIGFAPTTRSNIFIQLSQSSTIDIKLNAQATQLSELEIRATTGEIIAPTNTGTKTTISQQALERSATTTRNLVDFTKAAPQVSSSGPGFSGGGMSNRMNNVQIDGATERDVFGLGSTGQPGGQISAKAISIDAIKEYQILLAPYDVRQGNFGGLLLNAVTKSGTNEWHGSAFNYYRNQDYGRDVPVLRATEFNRKQLGFSLGGPIIKDKLHFFTANEWTRETTPVSGPYLGQASSATTKFPFVQADIDRFDAAYKTLLGGTAEPGTAGIVNTPTPMNNLFGRVDFQINASNRLVARYNYTDATNDNRRQNGRTATQAVLSSNFHSINSKKNAPVVQLFSNFKNGMSNEAFGGITWVRDRRLPKTTDPQIRVQYAGGLNLYAGADQFSQGNELDADTYEFTDNFTIPRGSHSLVIGTRNEYVKIRNLFTQSSYGVWNFGDVLSAGGCGTAIQCFEKGIPNGFRRAFVLSNDGNVYFDALQSAIYAQDTWTATPKLTVTAGIRGDISNFLTDNSYAPAIDSAYPGHSTPKSSFQFSPRVGFNYDLTGDQINQVRGGIGLFVGTPPYVWMENAYAQNGNVITFLNCGSGAGNATNPAPVFNKDPNAYTTCADGKGTKPIGDVSFLDKGLKFPQPMRANVAYDRVLPFNLVATVEGLYSKTLNQLFFVNRNLAAPVGKDAHGRTLYGTIAASGVSTAIRPPLVVANGGTARFSTAIDVENQNKDYAYNLTAQLRKRYSNGWEALVAYNYGHAYDVQSFTSSTHISNWQFGRTLSGRQEDPGTPTVSLFDQPHKISAFVTKTLGWGKLVKSSWASGLATDITVAYSGVSGPPHDYIYGGASGRGDLNADGVQGNDLIYVPTDVNDQTQIRYANFTAGVGDTLKAADQAAALEQVIQKTQCLRENRGKILDRNSCRLPFSNNFDVTVRQNVPLVSGSQRVTLQLDIFNFGNLLNKDWGQQKVSPITSNSNIALLTHSASSSADATTAVPVVQFNYRPLDPNKTGTMEPYQVGNFVSNYWRMQLSARVSF